MDTNARKYVFSTLCAKYLTVETQAPLRISHSPGLAVFPHSVPRLYSLSRKATLLRKHQLSFDRQWQFWFYETKTFYSSCKYPQIGRAHV